MMRGWKISFLVSFCQIIRMYHKPQMWCPFPHLPVSVKTNTQGLLGGSKVYQTCTGHSRTKVKYLKIPSTQIVYKEKLIHLSHIRQPISFYFQVWVQVPLAANTRSVDLIDNAPVTQKIKKEGEEEEDEDDVDHGNQDPWRWWNRLRRVCHHHKRLGIGRCLPVYQ